MRKKKLKVGEKERKGKNINVKEALKLKKNKLDVNKKDKTI